MARIRTVKPEFTQSESMGRVSRDARLTFILMWNQADDAGRMRANVVMLARTLYPYDDDAKELMPGWLTELERADSIQRYEVDGKHYIAIVNWSAHQKIDHPTPSRLPPPPAKKTAITKRKTRAPDASPPVPSHEPSLSLLGREGIGEEGTGIEDCSEPKKASEPTPAAVIELPTNKADESFAIQRKHLDEFTKLYPAVNVEQELRAMRGWLIGNVTKRKTHRGMLAFVNRWLARAQDQGGGLASGITFDLDKAVSERLSWIDAYGLDGRWIANTSTNGLWIDAHGVGPPPHDARTLVTESDMARFPKALAMRAKLSKQEPST